MGYLERMREIKEKLMKDEPIWIPEKEALVIPPNIVFWLGAEDGKSFIIDGSPHEIARYVVTGRLSGSARMLVAVPDDLRPRQEAIERAFRECSLGEPYSTRLASLLVFEKLRWSEPGGGSG